MTKFLRAAFAVLIGLPFVAQPAIAAYPGENGLLAYASNKDGGDDLDMDIYVTNRDGSDEKQLTNTPAADLFPRWSPGGQYIAFTRYLDRPLGSVGSPNGRANIYVMRPDGSDLRQLTFGDWTSYYPTWSPDGSRIAFSSDRGGNFDIWTVAVNGTDLRQITSGVPHEYEPAWSPDGTTIAFVELDTNETRDLALMNSDGTNRRVIVDFGSAGRAYTPDWSPAGEYVAYTRRLTPDDWGIVVARHNGSSALETDSSNYAPTWTPDGAELVWQAGGPFWNDYIMSRSTDFTQGAPWNPIVPGTGQNRTPGWQPIPAFPLVDARFSIFEADIVWAYEDGITGGCSPERYCPTSSVTRGQMAAFLDRALELGATTDDSFSDDETSIFEDSINRLAAAGITGGCGNGRFCPNAKVSRGQMAAFLARAFDLPTTPDDYFTDDETSIFEDAINRVASAGITGGCASERFCPSSRVNRGQMAAFLHRAIE